MSTVPLTYVDFLFWRLDPEYRRAPREERRIAADEFTALLEDAPGGCEVRLYSCLGFRAEAELLTWVITPRLADAQAFAERVYATRLGAHLVLARAFLGTTKPPSYGPPVPPAFQRGVTPKEYVIVYPFTKTHEWYRLPYEERRRMMEQHRDVGRRFPQILRNDTYQFGLGDDDFMLAFECDEPRDFSDLMQALRETEVRAYTKNDTPFFVCRRRPPREIVHGLLGLAQ